MLMGGGCPKKLIQNYTLDERKNEVNGSNNEINHSDILLILFSKGLKNINFLTSWKILLCVSGEGGCKNLPHADRGDPLPPGPQKSDIC